MSLDLQPPLETLAEWLRSVDVHAEHRLPLLVRAERILDAREHASGAERKELADQLERWRYQHLRERAGQLVAKDRQLAGRLDVAANELAGRAARSPRWPRGAIATTQQGGWALSEALAGLGPQAPLEELVRRAAEQTRLSFAVAMKEGMDSAAGKASRFADRDGQQESLARRILLYAPVYLSSHCVNHCVYCGFRFPEPVERRRLSADEALQQAEILGSRGFRHILLVAGDYPRLTGTAYFVKIIRLLVDRGFRVAIEIAPQSTASYAQMAAAGACGVTLYQETYHEQLYALYHPRGSKTAYDWRLEGLERAAEAGLGRLGLGVLLGLADPRQDVLSMMRHGRYLQQRFPDRRLAFSLPRIWQGPKEFAVPYPVDDETFLRMYCALRLAFPRAELVLSTRERPELRDRLATICITQMSAGSSTAPGGYADGRTPPTCEGGQFPICDHRSPAEVARWLRNAGLVPVWDVE